LREREREREKVEEEEKEGVCSMRDPCQGEREREN
jgi:hypothetical protein